MTTPERKLICLRLVERTNGIKLPHVSLPTNVTVMGCQYLSTETYDESCIVADNWHRRAA